VPNVDSKIHDHCARGNECDRLTAGVDRLEFRRTALPDPATRPSPSTTSPSRDAASLPVGVSRVSPIFDDMRVKGWVYFRADHHVYEDPTRRHNTEYAAVLGSRP
jgi:hypothetical protein